MFLVAFEAIFNVKSDMSTILEVIVVVSPRTIKSPKITTLPEASFPVYGEFSKEYGSIISSCGVVVAVIFPPKCPLPILICELISILSI